MFAKAFGRFIRQSYYRIVIIDLVSQYGRYGYRHVTELLRRRGWKLNNK